MTRSTWHAGQSSPTCRAPMLLDIARSDRSIRARSGHEPVATADRRHLEVQRRMTRMSAVVEQVLRRFAMPPDADERPVRCVGLTEVRAEPALAFLNGLHR